MQWFLGDQEFGLLNLEAHHLVLAIAKKTLDKNCIRTAQKTTNRELPSFKIGDRVYFKNKQPGKWDSKWRPGYWIVCIECNGHYIHIENQTTGKRSCHVKAIVLEPPVELWNIDMQFGRVGKFINHPTNLPTIALSDWRWITPVPVNNLHSSSSQHSMHDCTHQYNMEKQRISIVPACDKSIPHTLFLDDHSTCITRIYGEMVEAVH